MRRGSITKCGNGHVRFVAIESSWHALGRPSRPVGPCGSGAAGQPDAVVRIARDGAEAPGETVWPAAPGKDANQAVTAVARELLGFVWAMGQAVAAAEARPDRASAVAA